MKPPSFGLFMKQIRYLILTLPQPVKLHLNEKLDPKQKTIQIFNIDAQRFRKTKIENLPKPLADQPALVSWQLLFPM